MKNSTVNNENLNLIHLLSENSVLLSYLSMENAAAIQMMIANAKKNYVTKFHTRKITRIAHGSEQGKWKTYVGSPRKEIVGSTEEDLYNALYLYYRGKEATPLTFRQVTDEWLKNKQENQTRSFQTIIAYSNVLKRFLPEDFWAQNIDSITEDDVEKMFQQRIKLLRPQKGFVKKSLQYLNDIFRFAIAKHWCAKNPTTTIDIENYNCSYITKKKTAEEKEFSPEEIEALRSFAFQHADNPRSLIMLLAIETGMRCAELCALRWEDVEKDYLHIHRQQLIGKTDKETGKRAFYEVQYNKNERQNPQDGRRFPRTEPINRILELVKSLPGSSPYVFHDGDTWVLKDGYIHYLMRCCQRLGIKTTNNHAFRMALNGRLIDKGFNSLERSLLLGHSMETNERYYSLADRRRLNSIRERMLV